MPVWPICFCSCWPMPAAAPMRLPAARTPMSFMVTPPSARAARAASDARSTGSSSGYLPNFVMLMPRIQMSSLDMSCPLVRRLEAVVDCLGAGGVGADGERGQTDLHPERDVIGVGRGVDDRAPHAGAVAVDDGRDVRVGAGDEGRDDRERPHLAVGR